MAHCPECANLEALLAAELARSSRLEATVKGQAALLARAREFALDVQRRVEVAIEDFCGEEAEGG